MLLGCLNGRHLLNEVRLTGDVTFVHVRGHSGEEGNDRADRLVQWGKTAGPYSRMAKAGAGEGDGRQARVVGRLSCTKRPGEEIQRELVLNEGEVDSFTQLAGSGSDSSGSVVGVVEETQRSDDTGSVLRWLLRDPDEDEVPSSRRATVTVTRPDDTETREAGQGDYDGDDVGVVANWLASLDLG